MFAKPFKIKSFTTLKNTEKKSFAQRIADTFPSAEEQKVKELVPVKSTTHCLKLVLHSQQLVEVYVVNNVPLMIDTELGLVPTVCALWKVPELLPTVYIHAPVLPKILGGAPLYLPGVEIPPQGVGFPMFAKGALLAACTTDNKAAGVVGRAAMGSGDMLLRAAGICLETIHVYGDQLCREPKFDKVERPQFGAMPLMHHTSTEQITESISELTIKPARDMWPSLPHHKSAPALPAAATARPPAAATARPPAAATAHSPAAVPDPATAPNQPRLISDREVVGDDLNDSALSGTLEEDETEIPADMDGLLRWCLLSFLRLEGKHVELPLKTNLLYKNHLFPLCPPDRTLDVKKSTYKKMSKFLEAMQREGLLEVKEIDKGVDAVVSVNLVHPLVRAQKVPAHIKEQLAKAREPKGDTEVDYSPPEVREMLCVTAGVAELFKDVRKGTPLTASEVRSALTGYVKARSLNSAEQKGAVTLDATLAKIVGKAEQDIVKWDVLMSGVQSRMTSATEVRWAEGGTKLIKAKLDPITMQVATRSGNKKVTLVSNLEAYGFSLPALSHTCQLGVGASCGVTRSPGAKCDQLLLQGDQTHFVAKLLVEKYGLPKKFVEGADKALKKRK